MRPTIGRFWYAVATLTGTIVGVGIFGLPFVASRAGFFVVVLYLVGFAGVFSLLHLMFGEIMLRTKERHRMVGYVGLYLGPRARRFYAFATLFGVCGGMLVYVLVGGGFLAELTGGAFGENGAYNAMFWAVMSALLLAGLKGVERSELAMGGAMVGIIILLFFLSVPHVQVGHLAGFSISYLFLPYGVVLFSLAGNVAIPAVRDILKGKERSMRKAVVAGTVIPAALYVLFVVGVVGVTGPATSEDALSNLRGVLGAGTVALGAVLGIFLVATSYLAFGLYLRDTLRYDMRVPDRTALALTLFVPLALTFVHWGSFIEIIGFLGALVGGAEGLFLLATYLRARKLGDRAPEYALGISRPALGLLALMFCAGIVYVMAGGRF